MLAQESKPPVATGEPPTPAAPTAGAAPVRPAGTGRQGYAARAHGDPLAGPLARAVLARKVAFTPEMTATQLHDRLRARAKRLPDDAGTLLDSTLTASTIDRALTSMRESAVDLGTFDLDNDAALALLFYELRKHVEKRAVVEKEQELVVAKAEADESAFLEYRKGSPVPERTFELAFLGAGAATAYYLTSMPRRPPRKRTVVIGPVQPWREQRGPGVINHPMHMISPLRDEVGLHDTALAPRDAFSQQVEAVLDKHAGRRFETTVTSVRKLSHRGRWYYEIELKDDAPIYARSVVAGLGIGPHLRGGLTHEGKPGEQDRLVCGTPKRARALDLDEFQRDADDIASSEKTAPTVVVSGPNAGIDAVMTCLRKGFTIIWVLGNTGEPKLLPGTDNEIVEIEYTHRKANLDSPITQLVQGRAVGAFVAEGRDKPIVVRVSKQPPGAKTATIEEFAADYFVMALGPNVLQVVEVFDKGTIRDRLAPTYDRNRAFDDPANLGMATIVGLEALNRDPDDETSLQIIGGSAYRMSVAPSVPVPKDKEYVVRTDYLYRQWSAVSDAVKQMLVLTRRFEGIAHGSHPDVVERMEKIYEASSDYRFKVIGSARRIARTQEREKLPGLPALPDFADHTSVLAATATTLDKRAAQVVAGFLGMVRYLERYHGQLEEYRRRVDHHLEQVAAGNRPTDPRLAGESMTGVIRTLPLNVAINDQLTAIRSQIEAQAGFVPSYVTKEVDYATDSATVLQVHIAAKYPYLTDKDIDMWVDRIVRWRRPEGKEWEGYPSLRGPLPNPLAGPGSTYSPPSRDRPSWFRDFFDRRLAEENEVRRRQS